MTRFAPLMGPSVAYGFGLFVEHHPKYGTVVFHSGGYPGYSSHMRWHPESGIGIIAFENATYSQVGLGVSIALEHLAEDLNFSAAQMKTALESLWPETRAAQTIINQLLVNWSDATAESLFADNVVMDQPTSERRAHIDQAIQKINGLDSALEIEFGSEISNSPSHLVWNLLGNRGRLRIEICLNPEERPRVQTFKVRVE